MMRNRSQQAVAAVAILLVALTTIGAGLLLALSDNPNVVGQAPTATRFVIPTIGPSPTNTAEPTASPSPTATPISEPTSTRETPTVTLTPSPTEDWPSPTRHPATPHATPTLWFFVATLGPGPTQTTTTTDGACSYPNSTISEPRPGDVVSGTVMVTGSAAFPDFDFYKLELRERGTTAADYVTIHTGHNPIEDGLLMEWPTHHQSDGGYWLRLVVVDSTGNYPERCAIAVTVEN